MRWLPLLLLSACGPVTGVAADAETDAPATPDVALLDAVDAQEATAPDVVSEPTLPDAPACEDRDRDGHGAAPCGDDCDDNDPRAYPGQQPRCDSATVDSDCNGVRDELQQVARSGRCAQEGIALGLSQSSVLRCASVERGVSCSSCRGSGAARMCVCWTNGSMSYQGCAPND